ncbi:hypothetical protein AB0K00_25140 [Dactylosporangium sp. NPDC049525]|uniref:hypothetical protein n=1 Tax=Dactylosporangium sp. NPDC049525 TaxID=3154730 RepID=UPI003428BC52
MLGVGGRASFWTLVTCGAVVTVGAWLGFWWLAVPRHEICAMTLPAPAGCGSGRVPVAVLWSAITLGLYGVVLLVAAKVPRRRWGILAVLGQIIAAAWGYFAVLYT